MRADMSIDLSTTLHYAHGLWLGTVPTRFGLIELVLDGTEDAPCQGHLNVVQQFMPNADATIERLRRCLPWSFLWRPIRLAPNNENRLGIQFQHRVFNRRELLFADEQ